MIEDIKRWHSIELGALIGVALAYAWNSVGTSVEGYRAVDNMRFEQELTLKDNETGQPLIKSIVIHPAEDAFDGKVNIVTYKRLAKDKQGRVGWLDKRVIAKIPYNGSPSIADYLKNQSIKFNNGWWLQPRWAMTIGCVGGMVLLGGIWPSLLNVMLGAGLGRKRDPEEEERKKQAAKAGGFDWGSLLRKGKKAEPAHAHASASAGDQRELHDVAAAYERNLGSTGASHSGNAATAVAEGPVRKLEGGALEEAKPMPKPGDDDEIEVKGEYYPVLIHHKKQHDADAKPQDGAQEKK
jgi:hypothetical protein